MNSILVSIAASAVLLAAPAFAQGQPGPGPATATAPTTKQMDMSRMSDSEMHAHCKEVLGHKMDGRVPHDHSVEKLGHAPPPARPLSEADMKKMHDKCAAMMASEPAAKPK